MSKVKSFTSQGILEVMYNYKEILQDIQNARNSLDDVFAGTAQYGLQASMPKASGGASDVVYSEVVRRERVYKMLDKMQSKITMIQMFCDDIAYDKLSFKDKMILEYTLLQMTQKEIAEQKEIQLSQQSVSRRQRYIADAICSFCNNA